MQPNKKVEFKEKARQELKKGIDLVAPKTKKDQEKLIKALDIVSGMLEPNNCNKVYPINNQ